MKQILTALFLLFAINNFAQSFQADIVAALKLHEDSDNIPDQYKALGEMEKVVKKHSKEWLPNYWAAYQCTQIARLKGRDNYPENLDPNELLDRSEKYWKQASDLAQEEITNHIKCDLHALKSLIYSLKKRNATNEDKAKEYEKLHEEELNKATSIYPDSPVLMVMAATTLATDKEGTYANFVAAVHLMKKAKQEFEAEEVRALTTNFNQEWIGFWLPWVEKKITYLSQGEKESN